MAHNIPKTIPKRSEEVMGHRTKAELAQRETSAHGAVHVPVPPPDEGWHPIALRWYAALGESGQAQFYEPSDWAMASFVAEMMTRNLATARPNAPLFAAIMSGCTELMCTEGARRRLRLELQRPDAAKAAKAIGVTAISDYKKRISQ
jgi:hypothetical protein